MRHLIDLLNTFACSAARMQSSLPQLPIASATPAAAQHQAEAAASQPLSPGIAAAHPALAATEAALVAKLADNAAACDVDYISLHCLNDSLAKQRGFAAAEAGRGLNRYTDVLPYDGNRILLAPAAAPNSDHSTTGGQYSGDEAGQQQQYINASPLEGQPGDVSWGYIAAQGPLRHTRDSFWQMVVQERVKTVVMLTNLVERGVAKCARYYPERPATSKLLGPFLVTTRTVEELLPDLYRRKVVVEDAQQAQLQARQAQQAGQQAQQAQQQRCIAHSRSTSFAAAADNSTRPSTAHSGTSDSAAGGTAGGTVTNAGGTPAKPWSVRHYQYAAWPDHGSPASPHALLALCAELRRSGAHAAPILVHCSAGIGRSGVFCVLDVACRRLLSLLGRTADRAAGAAAVDVAALVAQLRQQRLGMVQTRDQFVFCHSALLCFVRQLGIELEQQGQQQRRG